MGLVWAISLSTLTYLHQASLHSTKDDILSSLGSALSRIESEVSKRAAPAPEEEAPRESNSAGGNATCPESMKGIYSGRFQHLQRRWGPADTGEMDSDKLIPWMAAIYKHMLWNSQLKDFDYDFFVDIGANVGRATTIMMDAFMDLGCRSYNRDTQMHNGAPRVCGRDQREMVVSFEPSKDTWEVLTKRAEASHWKTAPWMGVKAAVSDIDEDVKFYSKDGAGDEQASLQASTSHIQATEENTQNARSVSLNKFFQRGLDYRGEQNQLSQIVTAGHVEAFQNILSKHSWRIFLLKIDTEGYDYEVVRGAMDLLRIPGKIKFLVVEYHFKWTYSGRDQNTLKQFQLDLGKIGYECFFIFRSDMVPISGDNWVDDYEVRQWSNVFCGRKGDPEVRKLVNAYNSELQVRWA